MEEQINSIEQLREYYPDGKFDWPEIIQNFKLTKKFMNDNIANLDTILLFENQELDLEFVVQNIIYFNINDIEKYLNIKDPSMIVSLQAKKDETIKKSKQIEEKVEAIEEKETKEVLDVISEIESITTQSEQAFYQNATSNPLLVKKLVRKEELSKENNQEQEEQEIDFSENNNLNITFNKKEEIKELEKIINTKTPFVQKEDIINKEPKSVVDLIFQDLPKTNIINDDKLLSPIEVSEYIFKLLEEIEVLKDKINKLEKQNT